MIEWIHEHYVKGRRVRVLTHQIQGLLPKEGHFLDIGAGDGQMARRLAEGRRALRIEGIDPLVRPDTAIPVTEFDGLTIPFPDQSFDGAILIDVLHHAEDPARLLAEAARVSRDFIILKDHVVQGLAARSTLRFMDDAHNRRFGVALPYNYLDPGGWGELLKSCRLRAEVWETRVKLYPVWANWWFGRRLHVIARLVKADETQAGASRSPDRPGSSS